MTQGCRCPDCFGLKEYLEASGLDSRGLPPAPGHKPNVLRVVTFGSDDASAIVEEVLCDGSYTCECAACVAERAELVARRRAA